MPGLVPGIHALLLGRTKNVDGRVKPGHDGGVFFVIPGRASARIRNLEIPGSILRIAPE